jgi:hypothetical protein
MTQYLLSVHGPAEDTAETWGFESEEQLQQAYAQTEALNAEMQKVGAWVFGGGLQPVSSATVVSNTNGDVTITDGPYAETKEYLGGFWVIEANDLDAALAWAAKASAACMANIEVRPFQDEPAQ